MAALHHDDQHGGPPAWLGVVKGLSLILFALACLLLTQAMVANHFFSGGALNYRMSSR